MQTNSVKSQPKPQKQSNVQKTVSNQYSKTHKNKRKNKVLNPKRKQWKTFSSVGEHTWADTAKTYVCLFFETWSYNILKRVGKVSCLKHLALLGVVGSISPYLKHYEGLSYDRDALHRRHLRVRRSTASQENTLKLDFTAFHR